MKKKIATIDATPSKRLFLSIIADYDLKRSICELVDNGLDLWVQRGRSKPIEIEIELDTQRQTINVRDDAGGLRREDLRFIVAPGQTGTKPTDKTIGIFGVGTKRAVVALAEDVKISSRAAKGPTHRIEFDDAWIHDDESWDLPVFEVDKIDTRTTIVDLSKLRFHIDQDAVAQLKEHLRTTYAFFLIKRGLSLKVNGERIMPRFFDNWAYPPKYPPHKYSGVIQAEDGYSVNVEVHAGLALESSPAAGEYGVYFYCNDRLIARALKTMDVGFAKGFAGLPHPKVSLTRVLVFLKGDARAMPWNSSKSDISTQHVVFEALRQWLVEVVKDYATLSRIWIGDWPAKVFKYHKGDMKAVRIDSFPNATKSFLPSPPRSRPRYAERIAKKNKTIAFKKPWTKGLYEGVIASELILKNQHMDQRNRIGLIVLDSTLEIAFKEYLVHDSGTHYSDKQLATIFAKRHLVENEVQRFITVDGSLWKKAKYYNNFRNKLIHERATVNISDPQIDDFRRIVQQFLRAMYELRFEK